MKNCGTRTYQAPACTTTRIAAAVAALLAATSAGALEWQTHPTVSLVTTNDTNFRMRTVAPREVASAQLDASANIVGAAEHMTLELRPRVYSIDYNDAREFDRTNAYLYTSLELGGERQQIELSADLVRDGTLTNFFEDTGYTEVDADRDRQIYGVEWARRTSERGQFSLAVNAQSVVYVDELPGSPLTDYDYSSVALSYAHSLSEFGTLSLSLYGGALDTQSPIGNSVNQGLSLTFERQLSESLTLRIGGGEYQTRRPDLDAFIGKQSDSSLDFSIDKRWDRWSMSVNAAAATEPSAYGVLYRREQVGLSFGHQFTERVRANLRVNGAHIVSTEPLLWNEDRRYAYGQLDIDWRVAEKLWLSFQLGSRDSQYEGTARATGDYGQVAFSYRGRGS